jgi:SAM-dependent methyltransferase
MQQSSDRSNQTLVRQLSAWLNGIDYEINWWTDWIQTNGSNWPDDFAARKNPDREVFDPNLFEGMDTTATQKVLDVGAGPATCLGHRLNGKPIELTACDPLAPQYAAISAQCGVTWPVQTISGFAEDLSAFFPRNHFDMVFCRNALDHSFDPVRGIEEMLLVLKVGGRVNLTHFANEAEEGKYVGFHQWNFDVVGGRPVIWNPHARIDLIDRFGHCADVSCKKNEARRLVEFRFDKKRDPELPENRAQLRIAELLLATRDAFLSRAPQKKEREVPKKQEQKRRRFVISAQKPQGEIVES